MIRVETWTFVCQRSFHPPEGEKGSEMVCLCLHLVLRFLISLLTSCGVIISSVSTPTQRKNQREDEDRRKKQWRGKAKLPLQHFPFSFVCSGCFPIRSPSPRQPSACHSKLGYCNSFIIPPACARVREEEAESSSCFLNKV